MKNMKWEPLIHPVIEDGYLISPYGDIRHKDSPDDSFGYRAQYHATNGYDYALFLIKKQFRVKHVLTRLFPIDEIVALVYLPIPKELENKPRTIKHLNGNTRDISLENMIWVEDVEIWKDLIYPNLREGMYKISNHGRIINKITFIENIGTIKNGYLQCGLMDINNQHLWLRKNRLVAAAFVDRPDSSMDKVNHIDGLRYNDHWKNLEWTDAAGNSQHAILSGLVGPVSHHPNAKNTDEEIEKICELIVKYNGNISKITEESDRIGISINKSDIMNIMHKNTWVKISNKYFDKPIFKKLSEENVIKIAKCIAKYLNGPDTAINVYNELKDEIPNLKLHLINNILYKNSFKRITDNIF